MAKGRLPLIALALLTVLVLGGCHSRPSQHAFSYAPHRDDQGRAGSLVMPSDTLRRVTGDAPPAYLAWYAGRNDIVPSVTAGYASTRYEQSVTYTRDRQTISGGRVYDHYNQTTYRRTFSESAR